ncbi:unnamed protein product [Effrenium voratum]|nr:unnamed protein product [Effrenium voratum]
MRVSEKTDFADVSVRRRLAASVLEMARAEAKALVQAPLPVVLHTSVKPANVVHACAEPEWSMKTTEEGFRFEAPMPQADASKADVNISDTEIAVAASGQGCLTVAWPSPVDSSTASASYSKRSGKLVVKANRQTG